MYVKTNAGVVINFWTYQLDPGIWNFIKFSYQLGVWTWHWVLFQMFITGSVWYLVKGWFLAGLRQVYTWCWNWYRIGTMLLLAQGPPTLVPMQCWYCLKTSVFMCVNFFAHMQKIKRKYPTTIFLDFLKKSSNWIIYFSKNFHHIWTLILVW